MDGGIELELVVHDLLHPTNAMENFQIVMARPTNSMLLVLM